MLVSDEHTQTLLEVCSATFPNEQRISGEYHSLLMPDIRNTSCATNQHNDIILTDRNSKAYKILDI